MSVPCARCGVRADIGCKHQAATGDLPPAIKNSKVKERKSTATGQGRWAFHPPKQSEVDALFTSNWKKPK